jgi:hypothetical protein
MSNERESPERLTEFEQLLAALTPRAGGVNRDQLMFRAGQASANRWPGGVRQPSWAWPLATVVSAVAAGLMGVMLVVDRGNHASGTVAVTTRPDQAPDPSPAAEDQPLRPAPYLAAHSEDEPATTTGYSDSHRVSAQLFTLRQWVLAGDWEGLDESGGPSPDISDTVMASTYWDESRRLLSRPATPAPGEIRPGPFSNWRALFTTGEHL